MKKVNLLLLLSMLSFGLLFTSCGETTDETEPPVISFEGSPAETTEIMSGDSVTYDIVVKSGSDELKSIKIVAANEEVFSEDLSGENYTTSYTYKPTANDIGKTVLITITVESKDDETAKKDLYVTVKDGVDLTVKGESTLGGQSGSEPTFFSVSDNAGISMADGSANAAKIDFVYYYGSTNKATIASPADETVNGDASNGFDWTKDWSAQNATKFATSTIDFDAAKAGDLDAVTPTETKITMLEVGSVVVFMTEGGAKGIFKVTALTENADGSITIDIQVK